MIKAISLFFLVIIATTGCKAIVDDVPEVSIETPETIAVFDSIPEAIKDIPTYPENPESISVKEYDRGYEVEIVVPNPYPIARAAWITAYQERLWQIENEVIISENNFSWVTLKKDNKPLFIKIKNSGDEKTTLTTFIKK